MLHKKGLVDAPWRFNQRSVHSDTKFGIGAGGYYDTISDEDLINIFAPWIDQLYHKNAIVFFWVINSKMKFCLEFIEACGFDPSTKGFEWVKTYPSGAFVQNPGHHKAANTESLWIGIRGSMGYREEKMLCEIVETVEEDWYQPDFPFPIEIRCPRVTNEKGKVVHSAKPEIFRELIDRIYPTWLFGKGLELFARQKPSPDWLYFGNQIESDIKGPIYIPDKQIWEPAHDLQTKLF